MSDAREWDESADLLIVGSGAGSMVAALKARALGLSAIILEKQNKIGGSTGFSGGIMWVPDNPLMHRDGEPDSLDEARTYLDAASPYFGPGSTAERREAFLRSGPEMVDFMIGQGFAFERLTGHPDYYSNLPGAARTTRGLVATLFDINRLGSWAPRLSTNPALALPMRTADLIPIMLLKRTWSGKMTAAKLMARVLADRLTGRRRRGLGAAIQGRLLEIALRNGIDIRPETPVRDFVERNGRVEGVVAETSGGRRLIEARRGVIVDVGGFAYNPRLRQAYGPSPASTKWSNANPGETGEVIEAAMALGAATDCMDEAIWSMISLGPNESLPPGALLPDGSVAHFSHHFDISLPHSLMVDQDGRRFANEAGSYMEIGQRMYRRHKETGRGVPAWAIIESRHRERYPWGRHFGATPQSWFDSGYMLRADSLPELARLAGIDEAGLLAEIGRFNGFTRAGKDTDFGRGDAAFDNLHGDPTHEPNCNLGVIERPPFYAVRVYPGDVGTFGGLVTDPDARVLREDGKPIHGLYAAGNCTASVFGRSYIGPGTSIAASMVFAYRAVLNAARANAPGAADLAEAAPSH